MNVESFIETLTTLANEAGAPLQIDNSGMWPHFKVNLKCSSDEAAIEGFFVEEGGG